jgi:hypothetical protein
LGKVKSLVRIECSHVLGDMHCHLIKGKTMKRTHNCGFLRKTKTKYGHDFKGYCKPYPPPKYRNIQLAWEVV